MSAATKRMIDGDRLVRIKRGAVIDHRRAYLEEHALADLRAEYFLRRYLLAEKTGHVEEFQLLDVVRHLREVVVSARVVLGNTKRGLPGIGVHSVEERQEAARAALVRFQAERQARRCGCSSCGGAASVLSAAEARIRPNRVQGGD